MTTSCRGKGLHGTAISWEKHALPGQRRLRRRDALGRDQRRLGGSPGAAPRSAWRRAAEMSRLIVAAARDRGRRRRGRRVRAPGRKRPAATKSAATKPPIHKRLIPYPKKRKRRHGRLLQAPLRRVQVAPERPEADRHPLRRGRQHQRDLQHLRPEPARRRVPRAAQRLLPLRRRPPRAAVYKFVPPTIRCRHTVGLNTSRSGSSTSASATATCSTASASSTARCS